MLQFVSTTGGAKPVDFETAILNGFAPDGGLYVPEKLPEISIAQMQNWHKLSFTELAFEILSLFIDKSIIPHQDLKELLHKSYATFDHPDVLPLYPMKSREATYIMELFHGPSLSFKDVAMGFLVNLFDYFLQRKAKRMHIVVATTGDTGPAAACASAGKKSLDIWVLYPVGLITEEQVRQMTTIEATNVHPVSVVDCPDGADDLDLLVAELFAHKSLKEKLNLSSVNSINWGRVMMQTVHYFYAYFQVVSKVGERVNFVVPSGAFGNLCSGTLARKMGLPVGKFICANNSNACLHRIFSQGMMKKEAIIQCAASAIDILIPYNFWRYLYFTTGQQPEKIKQWMTDFKAHGKIEFAPETYAAIKEGFLSDSISDEQTLSTIKHLYEQEKYLLDPHGAVAIAALENLDDQLPDAKTVCLATAHPAKFPAIMQQVFGTAGNIPEAAFHPDIESAKQLPEKVQSCHFENMRKAIPAMMETVFDEQHSSR